MKIVCGGCSARHWLPDANLASGSCRVVCPRCSTERYIDASMLDPQALEPRWYVAVNDESVGPLSAQDLELYYQNGQVTLDSYVWADGLSDWTALSALEEFSYLASVVNGEAVVDDATRVAARPQGGGYAGMGYAPLPDYGHGGDETAAIDISSFEQEHGGGGYSPFDGHHQAGIVGMDGHAASMEDDFQLDMNMGRQAPAPAAGSGFGTANDLIGARSENSVLFSLSSLQAVSAGGKSPTASKANVPVTNGSGLIDVKALASTGPAPRRRNFEQANSYDPGAMMPMTPMLQLGTKKDNTVLYVVLGVVGVVIVGLAVVVIVLMTGGSKEELQQAVDVNAVKTTDDLGIAPPTIAQQAPTQPADTAESAGQGLAPVPDQEATKPVQDEPKEPAVQEPKVEPAPVEPTPAQTGTGSTRTGSGSGSGSGSTRTGSGSGSGSTRTGSGSGSGSTPTPTETKPVETKPAAASDSLSKNEVQGVIRSSFGDVRTCSRMSDQKGTMNVSFVIKGNGRVSNARVVGDFANTPVASCVLKVVNGLKFRETGGADLPITYPFSIQ